MSFKDNIRYVTPYVPGEQPSGNDNIKLNTNENPYPPSPKVAAVLRDFDYEILKKYPDPDADILVSALSKRYGVSSDKIFVGVGSDDVLAMCFITFFNSHKPVLFADITYSFYPVWCSLFNISYQTISLSEDFTIKQADYDRENGGIVIANPNAPTGLFLDISDIEYIVKNNQDSVCIVDEAYVDFAEESALPLIEKYDNLLIVRTFSKSMAMAGSRIGYAFGSKVLIDALKACKFSFNSYTMDSVTLALGEAALSDGDYYRKTIDKIKATRENAKSRLGKMGFEVLDSAGNFLFVSHLKYEARELFDMLKEHRIFVRYFNQNRIDNFLRITIGTDVQMDALFDVLEDYMGVE